MKSRNYVLFLIALLITLSPSRANPPIKISYSQVSSPLKKLSSKSTAEETYKKINNQKIATFVKPSFIKKGLKQNEIDAWKNLTAAANKLALKNTANPSIRSALNELPILQTFIINSIGALQANAHAMTRNELAQKAKEIAEKQKIAENLKKVAWQALMTSMHAQWSKDRPRLKASKVLNKEQEKFLDAYREALKQGQISQGSLKWILQTSGIATLPVNMQSIKYRDKLNLTKTLGDLLLNLQNYAYLLANHRYTTTHKTDKLNAAYNAVANLDNLFIYLLEPQWRTEIIGKATDKPAITLLVQAGAYADILAQLHKETFNLAHAINI